VLASGALVERCANVIHFLVIALAAEVVFGCGLRDAEIAFVLAFLSPACCRLATSLFLAFCGSGCTVSTLCLLLTFGTRVRGFDLLSPFLLCTDLLLRFAL
jgi:hypothetical protein